MIMDIYINEYLNAKKTNNVLSTEERKMSKMTSLCQKILSKFDSLGTYANENIS